MKDVVDSGSPVDGRIAVNKFTSGQALTDDEKRYLNLPVTPASATGSSAPAAGGTTTASANPAAGTSQGYEKTPDGKSQRQKFSDGKGGFFYGDWVPVVATTTTTTTPPADTGVTQSAKDIVNQFMRESGLPALSDTVWNQWKAGTTAAQIMDDIRKTPDYAQRFPGMAALNTAGRAISEAQYIAKEQADIDLMTTYGLPAEMAQNRTLLGNLIANNVNQVDLQKRLIAAQDSVLSKDKSVLDYASKTFGLTPGDLMAFALNPDLATPVIEQKAKAIQIGGAAFQANQALNADQAMALAAGGVTADQAKQGFSNIAQQGQFQQNLPGDVSGSLTNEELVNAQFGMDPAALAKLKKVAATRAGGFQEGGQFASSASGVTGLGSAPQV